MTIASDAFAPYVLELFVSNLERSLAFYEALDFRVERQDADFIVLSWHKQHRLFLAENRGLPPSTTVRMNLRLMVENVDAWWERVKAAGLTVYAPIDDRFYGLRDFTVLDPDGFGIRFAGEPGRIEN